MSDITFARLPQIPLAEIVAHMNDPRVATHLPLLSAGWTADTAQSFVDAKESHWKRNGLGHWAFLDQGQYIGWGGFQKEGSEWDFGLVLKPDHFGAGLPLTRQALRFAKADQRIPFVTFLLPPSRTRLRALDRLGARFLGEQSYHGSVFLKYRLETPSGSHKT